MRYKFVPDPDGDPKRYRLQLVQATPDVDSTPVQLEAQELERLQFLKWRVESGRLTTIPPIQGDS